MSARGKARKWRQSLGARQFTSESFHMNDETGGKRALRPPRGSSSRPGKQVRQNRLRHLLMISRGSRALRAIQFIYREVHPGRNRCDRASHERLANPSGRVQRVLKIHKRPRINQGPHAQSWPSVVRLGETAEYALKIDHGNLFNSRHG